MNLHDQFDDLAGEMTGTDLADLRKRVDRTSRHLRNRRMIASSAAAVAVVAALTTGAAALRIQSGDTRPDVVPAATVTPPSAPSSTPPSAPLVTAPSTVDSIPGALSFLPRLQAGKTIELHRYVNGTPQTVTFGAATGKDMYATPSPDGTRLAINTSPNGDLIAPGDLVVVSPGGARKTIARDVNWSGGSTVVWTPDGTALIAAGIRYDAKTGASRPFHDKPGYLAYSPGGTTIAYVHPTEPNAVKVTKVDGGSPRTVSVAGQDECERTAGCPTSVQAVSDDGRYVALGNVNSDPSHVYSTVLVYDTVAKQRLSQLGKVEHVFFRADGAIVVTATQVKVLDQAWQVVHTFPAPAHDAATPVFYRA
ncbi:hypothetical protein ACFO1B_26740 [Dactylosporangium siamense]|uniref:WD40 repeat domain-containing protein n=1 Tax=Dactylosporangium siamense TaxID=685454 RepID=A0A919PM16_9ACTN|nr:hypothetical protein [Dactylosporangium siamense]GIG46612.1 hypothetical protein Dsi01nite_046530 [Dactylosporangium siamense]